MEVWRQSAPVLATGGVQYFYNSTTEGSQTPRLWSEIG